jgi:hypothetical protein
VFHLTPAERQDADVSPGDLRAAVCADIASDDPRRYEYVGITLASLDLSGLVIETDGIEPLRFTDVTVTGELDLSDAVVRARIEFDDCEIGRLDAMDATVESDLCCTGCRFGSESGTCFSLRRATVEGRLRLADSTFDGSVELSACRIEGWFNADGITVTGGAHFPGATFNRAQVIDSAFERSAQWTNAEAEYLAVERTSFGPPPEFDGATLETLRFRPRGDVECRLTDATIRAGHLADAEGGRALYDLTDATLGDVTLDAVDSLANYRLYRTKYDGFSFPSYRAAFRKARWGLHEYAGTPETPADDAGLERTYLEAKLGASAVGDDESAAAFFVREMRYRRRRYAAHARDPTRRTTHRFEAALQWATNAFLDLVAGFGERPQRTVVTAVAVVLASALAYPLAGLRTENGLLTYGTAGLDALSTSLYFSVTTFTTLGPGDIEPAFGLSRTLTALEAFSGAFLVALFVFALGRRASR